MTKPLPCPFCGTPPVESPQNPEREGDAWYEIGCQAMVCPAKPAVRVFDDDKSLLRGMALARWNNRPELEKDS